MKRQAHEVSLKLVQSLFFMLFFASDMGACTMAPCNRAGKLWLEKPKIISPYSAITTQTAADMKKENRKITIDIIKG